MVSASSFLRLRTVYISSTTSVMFPKRYVIKRDGNWCVTPWPWSPNKLVCNTARLQHEPPDSMPMRLNFLHPHITSYHIISYHIISYHIISYHIISYHIISYHIKLYSNIIHQNKNTTWYWGHDQKDQKVLRHSCPNKGFNKYTETCKNTLYTHTDKNTQEQTRHAPKWNQLYSDNKTDFSWFRKCLVVLPCFTVLSREFQKEGPQFLIAQSENIFFVSLIL